MKVCSGIVIWGALAAATQQETFIMVAPVDWTRANCNDFFANYAAGTGARGAAVRFGCIFTGEPGAVWEGDAAYGERNCGW